MESTRIDSLEGRFDRVEVKLDSIGDSLRLLASVDERTIHVLNALAGNTTKLDAHEKRIAGLEQKVYLLMALSAMAGAVGKIVIEKLL